MNKNERRKLLLVRRASIKDREKKDEMILNVLSDLIDKANPESVFCYVSMGSEVETKKFIMRQFGKRKIFVPYTYDKIMTPRLLLKSNDLTTDKLGNIDARYLGEEIGSCPITIVPMVGFNLSGVRMGYGGGYYDKFLSAHETLSIGLAYDEQLDEDLPIECHDSAMNIIITQNGVRLCE